MHAKHANGPAQNESKAAYHTLDLHARVAEVEQHAEIQVGCLEIVHALEAMRIDQCFDGL